MQKKIGKFSRGTESGIKITATFAGCRYQTNLKP